MRTIVKVRVVSFKCDNNVVSQYSYHSSDNGIVKELGT